MFEDNSGREIGIDYYRDIIFFEKLRFQNVFRPPQNIKPAFSNSSGLKSVFEKLRFRDGLVWTNRLNRKNKAAFLNFSGVVLKDPHKSVGWF